MADAIYCWNYYFFNNFNTSFYDLVSKTFLNVLFVTKFKELIVVDVNHNAEKGKHYSVLLIRNHRYHFQ